MYSGDHEYELKGKKNASLFNFDSTSFSVRISQLSQTRHKKAVEARFRWGNGLFFVQLPAGTSRQKRFDLTFVFAGQNRTCCVDETTSGLEHRRVKVEDFALFAFDLREKIRREAPFEIGLAAQCAQT